MACDRTRFRRRHLIRLSPVERSPGTRIVQPRRIIFAIPAVWHAYRARHFLLRPIPDLGLCRGRLAGRQHHNRHPHPFDRGTVKRGAELMRFRPWPKPEPYRDTTRKRAAFKRKQRLEQQALPLFAEMIAAGRVDFHPARSNMAIFTSQLGPMPRPHSPPRVGAIPEAAALRREAEGGGEGS